MPKPIFVLFLAISVILFSSCNEVPPIETTTREPTFAEATTETTAAEETTLAETTTAEVVYTEPQMGGRFANYWTPHFSMSLYPWTITPSYEYESSEDYDIEITGMSAEPYEEMPRTVKLQITNKTGKPITQYGSPFLEMYDETAFGGIGAWVRMPFIVEAEAYEGVILHESSYEYELAPYEGLLPVFFMEGEYAIYYTMDFKDRTGSEQLKCRAVFYLNDGPHYVEFTLIPSSDPRKHSVNEKYVWPYGSWTYGYSIKEK